jgi:hypothetical protein
MHLKKIKQENYSCQICQQERLNVRQSFQFTDKKDEGYDTGGR